MSGAASFGPVSVEPVPFEEGLLGMPVRRVAVAGPVEPAALAALIAHLGDQRVGLASCRLAAEDPAGALLRGVGFRAVETLLTFQGPVAGQTTMPAGVRPAGPADIAACRRVAEASFRNDRFHADPAIDDGAASDLKAQWIENDIASRADIVLVAETGTAVAGFNACLRVGDTAVIDLIAVDPSAQGRGVGRALIAGAMAHYAGTATAMRAGTQEDNRASQKLYRHFGMQVVDRHVTLHWTPDRGTDHAPEAKKQGHVGRSCEGVSE